jgi:hypothetical protein
MPVGPGRFLVVIRWGDDQTNSTTMASHRRFPATIVKLDCWAEMAKRRERPLSLRVRGMNRAT